MRNMENTNEKKQSYTAPILEIVRFDDEDVITTSGLYVMDEDYGEEYSWDNPNVLS